MLIWQFEGMIVCAESCDIGASWNVLAKLDLVSNYKSTPLDTWDSCRHTMAVLVVPRGCTSMFQEGQLTQAHMSALSHFVKQHDLGVDAVTINFNQAVAAAPGHHFVGDWPGLSEYQLQGAGISSYNLHLFMPHDWSKIDSLALIECNLAPGRLSSKDWHKISVLSLIACGLDAAAISCLASDDWPFLVYLHLNLNPLGADGIECLVKCKMPLLQLLNLSDTALDASATKYLAQGAWPKLFALSLAHNMLDKVAVRNLLVGQWPVLRVLQLSFECVAESAFSILGVRNFKEKLTWTNYSLPHGQPNDHRRKDVFRLPRSTDAAWPQLTDILICGPLAAMPLWVYCSYNSG